MLKALSPRERWGFAAILALAAALRAWVALGPGAVHPDEIFQYLEQAHRAAFGYGVVTWEYRYGMRSWLLPLFLSLPMRLGEAIAPGTQLYLWLPKLAAAAVSLAIVPAAFALGARLSRVHGFVAMAVAATWHDLVYFGGHPLTEPIATALILAGAALLIRESAGGRRIAAAGLLLGLAALLRFHYLPGIGLFALLSCGTQWRARWLPLVAGGAAAAVVGGAIDAAMGQIPFSWVVANFAQNIVENRSAAFGVSPPLAYLSMLNFLWGPAFLALLLLVIPVLRPYRALLAAAALNLLLHSAIGHKEYRFVFLTVAIIVLVAAIGSAELLLRLRPRLPARLRAAAPWALVPLWLGASAALFAKGVLERDWTAIRAGSEAAAALRTGPPLCGVGLVGLNLWDTGGYSHLHRKAPLYVVDPPFDIGPQPSPASLTPAFNAVLAPEAKARQLPSAYRVLKCSSAQPGVDPANKARPVRVCALVRDGGCDPRAAARQELQAVMKRQDW